MRTSTTTALLVLSLYGWAQQSVAQGMREPMMFTCAADIKFPTPDDATAPSAPIYFANASSQIKTDDYAMSWSRYDPYSGIGNPDIIAPGAATSSNAPATLDSSLAWFQYGDDLFYSITSLPKGIGELTSTPPSPPGIRYADNSMYFFNYPLKLSQSIDLSSFNLKLIGLAANDQLVRIYVNNQAVSPSQVIADASSSETAVTTLPIGSAAAPQWVHGLNNISFAVLDTDRSNDMALRVMGAEMTGNCDPVITQTTPATLVTGSNGTFAGTAPTARVPEGTSVLIEIVDSTGATQASYPATIAADGSFTTTQPVTLPAGTYATRITVGDAAPSQMVLADQPLVITDVPLPASVNLLSGDASAAIGAGISFRGTAAGIPAGTMMTVEILDAQGQVVQTLSAVPTAADGSFTAAGTITAAAGTGYLVRATALVNGTPVLSNTLPLTITAAPVVTTPQATPVPTLGWLGLALLSLGMGAAGLAKRRKQA